MKTAFPLLSTLLTLLLFLSGCTPKPYSYPNYAIIKPDKVCQPNRENIQKLLNQYLGKPYIWAEEGPNAFDCSGLTYNIYGSMGVTLPRTACEQAKVGKTVAFKDLTYGDLIFFGSTNRRSRRISHVGMYLGDGWFAQASSEHRKVVISSFDKEPKYKKRIKICKRYMSEDERTFYMNCSAPLKKMKVTSTLYATPWKPGMNIPRKAVP